MENVNSIIGGTSSRGRSVSDESRISNASYINSISFVIVLTPQFPCLFGDSVDWSWVHDSFLRSLFGTVAAKRCDWTWPENFLNFLVPSCLQTIKQCSHVQLLCSSRIHLSTCWQKCCQTIDICNLVLSQKVIQVQTIERIQMLVVDDFDRVRR